MSFLTPTEQAYLFDNTREFTNAQQRYIRCRLRKKLRQLGEELERCNVAADKRERCNAMANGSIGRWDSLVRIPPNSSSIPLESSNDYTNKGKKIMVGRKGVEPLTPAMSRRYPNQARPPAQYTMKKFAAQIYVVDRLYMKLTNPLP
jgi:hypothetical protein